MSVNESNYLRGNFLKLDHELYDESLRLNLHLDQEEWSAPHHAKEALATATVCLMSGHHDCLTAITVSADELENCLMSLTLSIQSLQRHAMPEEARRLRRRKRFPLHV